MGIDKSEERKNDGRANMAANQSLTAD